MDIIVGTPSSITTPAAGYVTLFLNTEANNQLYAKFSDGTIEPYASSGAESANSMASAWTDGVMCALKRGVITAAQYQEIVNSGFMIQTTTDVDGNTTVSVGSRTVSITSITLNASAVTKDPAQTHQITITWDPTNAGNKTVQYVSSDAAVATVDSNGLVTAVATGTAVISVIPLADPSKTKTLTITVS